jgi:hypothetical protein
MFGLAAWNRLLRKQQEEKVSLSAHDVLGQKQISEQKGGQPDASLMYCVLPRAYSSLTSCCCASC